MYPNGLIEYKNQVCKLLKLSMCERGEEGEEVAEMKITNLSSLSLFIFHRHLSRVKRAHVFTQFIL